LTLCIQTPNTGQYLSSFNACKAYVKNALDLALPPVNGVYLDVWKILQYLNYRLPTAQNIGTLASGVNNWGFAGNTTTNYYVVYSPVGNNTTSYGGVVLVRRNSDNAIIIEAELDFVRADSFIESYINWCTVYINKLV